MFGLFSKKSPQEKMLEEITPILSEIIQSIEYISPNFKEHYKVGVFIAVVAAIPIVGEASPQKADEFCVVWLKDWVVPFTQLGGIQVTMDTAWDEYVKYVHIYRKPIINSLQGKGDCCEFGEIFLTQCNIPYPQDRNSFEYLQTRMAFMFALGQVTGRIITIGAKYAPKF